MHWKAKTRLLDAYTMMTINGISRCYFV